VNDIELIKVASAAAGLSARRFAQDVLGVDGRNVRRWERGGRAVPGTVRVVCAAIIARPAIAIELAIARVTTFALISPPSPSSS
jgi:DNA-binding transcriptional regulator YiaG